MATYPLLSGDFTSKAKEAFLNMLRGGASGAAWHPTFIDVGNGGDFNLSGVDTGARFAPVATETEIRKRLFRANIIYTDVIGEDKVKYIAFVDGHELIASDINEFALVSSNQTMISHLILPVSTTIPPRAERYDKSGYVKLFLEWTINIDMLIT